MSLKTMMICVLLCAAIAIQCGSSPEIVEIRFQSPDASLPADEQTLQSIEKIRTNHFPDGGPALKEAPTSFQRYQKLSGALAGADRLDSVLQAMHCLSRVRNGTAWSVIYESESKSALLAVDEDYKKLFRFGFQSDKAPVYKFSAIRKHRLSC